MIDLLVKCFRCSCIARKNTVSLHPKKNRIKMNRIFILCQLLLSAFLFPQCTQAQPQDELAEELPAEEPLKRFQDTPPVVDQNRRYQLPMTDVARALSGSYGELRPNHFHGGLDFKSDQTIGHPVHSFADGYVRRVGINAYGYGLVLYVEHPALGLTSVYGHLSDFSDEVWKVVRARQVQDEANNMDATFAPDEIPVTEGQVIALSGNTGSSGGPHVHFELRNIPDDDDDVCYDPMMYFLRELKDTQAPRISHVYLYPQAGQGAANGSSSRQVSPVTGVCATRGGEGGAVTKPLTAWGKVGLGLKAYDYMDGQANKYGVKELRLYLEVPGAEGATDKDPKYQLLYHFKQDAFRFSETRYTNSLTDYAAWVNDKSMIMKSFIEPGNLLQQVDPSLGDGFVDFCEERPYHFVYELEDAHGNLTSLDFSVQGQRAEIAPYVQPDNTLWIEALKTQRIDTAGFRMQIPAGTFYTDLAMRFRVTDQAVGVRKVIKRIKNKKGRWIDVERNEEYPLPAVSKVYSIGRSDVPMHKYCAFSIELPDTLENVQQLYVANLDASGIASGSVFKPAQNNRPNTMVARTREAGRFVVLRDDNAPSVKILNATHKTMQISVGDEESGVKKFRVLIDGKFVPFNMDNRGRYFGQPSLYGIAAGQTHSIEIYAIDHCGNETKMTEQKQF